jgi:phage gp36-like protein
MSYAGEADMIAAYGADALIVAADRDGDGVADAGVIEAALAAATAELDSYLSTKYPVPLAAPVPAVVRDKAVDIALYKLSQRPGAMTDEIKDRYEKALAWMRDVSRGVVMLGHTPGPVSTGGGGVQLVSGERRFTRDTLKGA